ncbi:hypothetical protein [Nocardia sp. alder85J]|uniref:hypothetical protein n=1 Tax=Nocardia sp. alder85J TaxID=2862949 RepID=UPI001CD2118C|nr:hypothetical protein [Nocardia sp. alder85J]MCX4096655.1 hypothetical protein [Nocardia sp. alder85J]
MGSDPQLDIDPSAYGAASAKCYSLATNISTAFNPLYQTLFDSGGMVGDYDKVKAWANEYDTHVGGVVTMATTLANSIQNMGDLLAYAGYNYAVTEYYNTVDASTDPPRNSPPPQPAVTSPLYGAENPVLAPASVLGHHGDGIIVSKIPGLLDHITTPVPNGDVTLLTQAADAWKKFAEHDAIKNAADTLNRISATLTADLKAPDLDHFSDHFTTLTQGATNLHSAATGLAPLVAVHQDGLSTLRTNVHSATDGLLVKLAAIGVATAAVVIATTIFSFGLGLAGGDEAEAGAATAAGATLVAEVGTTISSEVSAFFGTVLAGATAAFGGVTELSATALAAIAALSVVSVAGDSVPDDKRTYEGSPKHGKEQRGNAAPEPTHGQETLDRSVPIKPTTPRRVGYDPETGEFDVFDETHPDSGIYHGHQRTWDQLSQDMQNALVRAGVVNRRGKPL